MGFWAPILGALAGTAAGHVLNKGSRDASKRALAGQEKLAGEEAKQKQQQTALRAQLEREIREASKNPLPTFTFDNFGSDPEGFMSQIRGMKDLEMLMQLAGLPAGGNATSTLSMLTSQNAARGEGQANELTNAIVQAILSGGALGGGGFGNQLQSQTGLDPLQFSAFMNQG